LRYGLRQAWERVDDTRPDDADLRRPRRAVRPPGPAEAPRLVPGARGRRGPVRGPAGGGRPPARPAARRQPAPFPQAVRVVRRGAALAGRAGVCGQPQAELPPGQGAATPGDGAAEGRRRAPRGDTLSGAAPSGRRRPDRAAARGARGDLRPRPPGAARGGRTRAAATAAPAGPAAAGACADAETAPPATAGRGRGAAGPAAARAPSAARPPPQERGRAAAAGQPGDPGRAVRLAVAPRAGPGGLRPAPPLPPAGVAAVTELAFEDPCVLFALARESAPFRREFRPNQRFPGAPCRARFCGPAWLPVLVVETGVGTANTERALDWLLGRPRLC